VISDTVEKSLSKLMSKPRDCADILNGGESADGVYTVYLQTGCTQYHVDVFCDMTTDGGGWTVCTCITINNSPQLLHKNM